jgi:Protein of unknown function (DUF3052)
MGAEAPCSLVLGGGKPTAGKALLESDELIFRPKDKDKGGPRLTVPFASITSMSASGGVLTVIWDGKSASFNVGDVAAKWLEKIKNPKTRADKLGIKAGQRVALQGAEGAGDKAFTAELLARGAEIGGRSELDALFYWVSSRADVSRDKLNSAQKKIKKDGAIWIIRPKGSPDISEKDVYTAARDANLVDVKVVAFSATHTAEKMVIPVDRR